MTSNFLLASLVAVSSLVATPVTSDCVCTSCEPATADTQRVVKEEVVVYSDEFRAARPVDTGTKPTAQQNIQRWRE